MPADSVLIKYGIFFFLNFLLVAAGSSGLILSFYTYRQNKNPLFGLFALSMLFWTVNEFIELVNYFVTIILNRPGEMIAVIQTDFQFALTAVFVAALILLVERTEKKKFRQKERLIYFAAAIFVAFPIVNISRAMESEFLIWNVFHILKTIFSFGVIFRMIYLFGKSVKLIINDDIRKLIRNIATTALLLYPFVIIDSMKILSDGYFFGLSMSNLFFAAFNLLLVGFVTRYQTLPELTRVNDEEPLNRFIEGYSISKREKDVVKLLLEGLSYKAIADKLYISHETVKTHVNNIYKKTSVSNKIELINLIKSYSVK